jgi:hypothetical protein
MQPRPPEFRYNTLVLQIYKPPSVQVGEAEPMYDAPHSAELSLSEPFAAAHLAAVNLCNQMDEFRRSVVDGLERIAEANKSDHETAKTRESD